MHRAEGARRWQGSGILGGEAQASGQTGLLVAGQTSGLGECCPICVGAWPPQDKTGF